MLIYVANQVSSIEHMAKIGNRASPCGQQSMLFSLFVLISCPYNLCKAVFGLIQS